MVRREGGKEARERSRLARWITSGALAITLLTGASTEVSASAETGPIFPFTGAPQEPISGDGANCTFSGAGCHESFPVDSGPGSIAIEVPASYEPGMTYAITVDVTQEDQLRWGFQITVLDALFQPAGEFASTDANTRVQTEFDLFTDRSYITHSSPPANGTAAGTPGGNSWSFQWSAPATDLGPVTFWAAGNAADNSVTSLGDYIYTTSVTIPAPEPGSFAAGLVALSTTAALARRCSRSPA